MSSFKLPIGTRLQRIDRLPNGNWRLWIATANFVYGTYLLLDNNTWEITRVTIREDENDEVFVVTQTK